MLRPPPTVWVQECLTACSACAKAQHSTEHNLGQRAKVQGYFDCLCWLPYLGAGPLRRACMCNHCCCMHPCMYTRRVCVCVSVLGHHLAEQKAVNPLMITPV